MSNQQLQTNIDGVGVDGMVHEWRELSNGQIVSDNTKVSLGERINHSGLGGDQQ